MKSTISPFAKFLGFIFAFIFVIVLPIAVLAFDVGRVIFNPPLVTDVIAEITTESDLIPAALEWFSQRRAEQRYASGEAEAWVEEPDVVSLIDFMDANDWRTIRDEVLPDEILVEWVGVTVDGTYEWIDTDDDVPQITWNMQSFIRQVDSEHGTKSIAVAYSALPDCEQEQIEDFKSRLAAAPAGTEVFYNLCEFPDPWYEDQFSDYLESLGDLVSEIPPQFALTKELARIEDTQGVGPAWLKTQLRLLRTLMQWAPLIPLVLLLLILAFCIRTVKGTGRWWGVPLTLGGLLTLILGLVYRPLITWFLASGPLSEAPPLITEEATLAALRLAAEIFKPLTFQSIVIVALGLLLVVVGLIVKEKQPAPVPEQKETE